MGNLLITEKNENFWAQFGISYMYSYHICHGNYCYWDATKGKKHSSLFYITEGSVTFNMPLYKFEAKAGDYLFMPAELRYYSVWHGNPTAEFYSVDYDLKKVSNRQFDRSYDICAIECVDKKRALDDLLFLHKVHNLPREEITPRIMLKALSVFYALFSDSIPDIPENKEGDLPESLKKSVAYLEKHYKEDIGGKEISEAGFVSESRMYHLFSEHFKCSPIEYKNKLRIKDAVEMLIQTNKSIETIAYELGFASSAYFRKVFHAITGYSPRECRTGANKPVG